MSQDAFCKIKSQRTDKPAQSQLQGDNINSVGSIGYAGPNKGGVANNVRAYDVSRILCDIDQGGRIP